MRMCPFVDDGHPTKFEPDAMSLAAHPNQEKSMSETRNETPSRYRAIGRQDIDRIAPLADISDADRLAMKAVSAVLPFRVNNYIVDELIDWTRVPDDPMYQLTFPQKDMLEPADFDHMVKLVRDGANEKEVTAAARKIQYKLNPHPSGQLSLNVPTHEGEPVDGVQHKYDETVLFFPSQGQTCHAYCTYCFRWAQFVGIDELKFANRQADSLAGYLRSHKKVESVLFTGGDPMIMKTKILRRYVEPLLQPGLEHVTSIRFGTKAPAYWPFRFTTDADADDLLRLFEEIAAAGKHVALMAHFSHPVELATPEAERALARIRSTGAVIRCQAPLIRHVNDHSSDWLDMWRRQIELGCVPYYMFVERDTGARNYFEVPLARAFRIYADAYRKVTGLARTVRGPSMSANPGKVCVEGIAEIAGERVFALRFLQGRNSSWVNRPFFARYDPTATWLDDLRPAFGENEFFFEEEFRNMCRQGPRSLEDPNSAAELELSSIADR